MYAAVGRWSKQVISSKGRAIVHHNKDELAWVFKDAQIIPFNEEGWPCVSFKQFLAEQGRSYPLRAKEWAA